MSTRIATVVAAALVGLPVGYLIADGLAQEGFGALQGVFILLGLAGVAGLLVVVGVVSLLLARASRPRRTAMAGFGVTLVLLAVGLSIGAGSSWWATVALRGIGYKPPVVLSAAGSMSASLTADATPRETAGARCVSKPDSTHVYSVVADDLGPMADTTGTHTGRLQATADFLAGNRVLTLTFVVEGLALGYQPLWTGRIIDPPMAADAMSAVVRFQTEPYRLDFDQAPPPGATAPAVAWPQVLSGEVRWTCETWSGGD